MALLVGRDTGGTTADFNGAGNSCRTSFVAQRTGVVRRLGFHTKVANPGLTLLQLALYADSGGTGGTRLALGTVSGTITGTGKVYADIVGGPLVVAGTTYHLAWDSAGEQFDWQGENTGSYGEVAAGGLPDPWLSAGESPTTNHNPIIWAEGDDLTPTRNVLLEWLRGRNWRRRSLALSVINAARTPRPNGVAATSQVDSDPLTLKWDLAAEANAAALSLLWDLRAEANAAALSLVWDLRAAADAAALTLQWDLVAQINAAALTLVWDLRAAADAAALSLVWDLRAATDAAALSLIWDLRAAVDAAALTLIWDLASEVSTTQVNSDPLTLKWDVRAEVSSSPLSLVWDVAADAVAPPQGGGGGGRISEVPWKEVNSTPLTLIWGYVASPPAGKGALSGLARPQVPEPTKPTPLPEPARAAPKRPKLRRPVLRPRPVDSDALALSWRVYAGVDGAPLELRWGSTEDAREIQRLRHRLADAAAEIRRLTSDFSTALEAAKAEVGDARARIRGLEGELTVARGRIAALEDDTEALEVLLLSEE